MYYNMFIYIIWCGMADDMMKKEVKTTRQDDVVAGRVRVFDESIVPWWMFVFWNCSRYTHYKKA